MGIKTKKFSQLSATSDGKLILANDNKLYQSTSSLSELVSNSKGDYVALSSLECTIGNNNTNISTAFSQGDSNTAIYKSLAQGTNNSAEYLSLAVGENNKTFTDSMAVGTGNSATYYSVGISYGNSANMESFSQGYNNSAEYQSMTQGNNNTATNSSFAQGYENSADSNSLAQGIGNISNFRSMSQGAKNYSIYGSLAQGEKCSADNNSFAQGYSSNSNNCSLVQGSKNVAKDDSVSIGYINSAVNTAVALGNNNVANGNTFAQGYNNSGTYRAIVQGTSNTATEDSITQGTNNFAKSESIAQGYECNATTGSIAQGYKASADEYSLAQGNSNSAKIYSIAQGYQTSASYMSQAFGYGTIITNTGMAIGCWNKTSSDVAFVIGKGNGNPNSENYRKDIFTIYPDGSVSAQGKISANGVELGAGGGGGSNYSYITVNMPNITPSYDFTYVQIGNQKWMNSNLNINDGGSGYIEYSAVDNPYQGTGIYRNLYTYGAAKRIADSIPGWHLPTYNEISALFKTLGDCQKYDRDGYGFSALYSRYGKKLKSTSSWHIYNTGYENAANGTDDYGFNWSPYNNVIGVKDYDEIIETSYLWCDVYDLIYEGQHYPVYPYIYVDNHDNLNGVYDYVMMNCNYAINDNYMFNVRLIKDEE